MAAPLCLLLAAAVFAADRVPAVPPLSPALDPTARAREAPIAALQLRADLSALSGLPAAAPLLAQLQPLAAALPPSLSAPPAGALAPVETGALQRVELAQQVLANFDPQTFAKLADSDKEAALASLWDKWGAAGLAGDPLARADAIVIEGVDDRSLTSANKSVFLGAGVLGYPLADSLWLQRTRIGDALDENTLTYPSGQKWHTDDHTPEFLGTTKQAQDLVDTWGRAADFGKAVVAAVRAKSVPPSPPAPIAKEAAEGFGRLASGLHARGDAAALDYLAKGDPTLAAFLLDARKPGYYLYNADRALVERIMAAPEIAGLGIRRLEHGDTGAVVRSTYFYRPARVAARLREASRETAEHADKEKAALARYADRLDEATRRK